MEFLTVKETAQLLRVSTITVRRYIASGQLAAERVGRGIRVRRKAIEEFVRPVVPDELLGKPTTEDDPLWDIVGIRDSDRPNDSEFRQVDLVEPYLDDEDEADEPLGKPFTMDDPLCEIVGIWKSNHVDDVARNTYKYVAEAIMADKFPE